MYEYAGNIHIHSVYSDGSGSIDTIARAARRAGLDFIIVTDHSTLQGKVKEGYHHQVLVLVGAEFNKQCNHYLAMRIDEVVADSDDNPQTVIDAVGKKGGIGFLAHPFEKGSPLYKDGLVYPWKDWEVYGFTGIELWNRLSQWRDGMKNLCQALYLTFINPHRALTGPYPEIMSKWDEMLESGRLVVGIGGSDAHAIKLKLGPFRLTIDDYSLAFRCINTHILSEKPLTGDAAEDGNQVFNCLARGRCFVAYDYYHSGRGFRFYARQQKQITQMGGCVSLSPQLLLEVQTPYPAQVRLLKNGRVFRTGFGRYQAFGNLVPGIYRVEAYHYQRRTLRPWIYSNPIFVTTGFWDQ